MTVSPLTDAAVRRSVAAYVDGTLGTSSPEQLVVRLYDRLVVDLDRADVALAAGTSASEHLLHAQEIVISLLTSLDTSVWPEGRALSGVYTYLHSRLVRANVHRDRSLVASCLSTVVPLRDAWADAFTSLAPAASGDDEPGSRMTPVSA